MLYRAINMNVALLQISRRLRYYVVTHTHVYIIVLMKFSQVFGLKRKRK